MCLFIWSIILQLFTDCTVYNVNVVHNDLNIFLNYLRVKQQIRKSPLKLCGLYTDIFIVKWGNLSGGVKIINWSRE